MDNIYLITKEGELQKKEFSFIKEGHAKYVSLEIFNPVLKDTESNMRSWSRRAWTGMVLITAPHTRLFHRVFGPKLLNISDPVRARREYARLFGKVQEDLSRYRGVVMSKLFALITNNYLSRNTKKLTVFIER